MLSVNGNKNLIFSKLLLLHLKYVAIIYFQNGLKQYCFVVFLLECFFVAAFIFLVIPETKNKSFLEIKKEFHKLNFGRHARKKEMEIYERRQLQDEFLKISA